MLIGLAILWSIQTLIFGTAAIAVPSASRGRLEAEMKRRGRSKGLARFEQLRDEFALTALVFRQMGIVLFVVTLGVLLPGTEPWYFHPLQVLVLSAAWFLFFGASVPAAWARYAGEPLVAAVLPVLEAARLVALPALLAHHAIDEIVRRLAGAPGGEIDREHTMEQEILDALGHAETRGAVDEMEKAVIRSAIEFDKTTVAEIMTPRTDLIGVEASASYDEVRQLVLSVGHSRIPVYEETMDHVIGVLYAKDLLRVGDPGSFSPKATMRSIPFIPETKDLASLLREFQTGRVHIAIVLDEYGGTSGLVTIEDVLEELVGDITDEHEAPQPAPIRRLDARNADVDARVRVEEVNEELGLSLPTDEAYDTVGGYVLFKLGRIPQAGERLIDDHVRIEVLEAAERSIQRLRIQTPEPAPTE